ncbi:conjugal transfer protein TraG N-terminal domain-containing protein, partial [Vibrio navarrensis]|nr:conjugal transfer protein TraG N-terminal domain-containing protein [Vibrio navarrensis]
MAATFDIVSFGDVTTLNTVFNAVAAITQDSSYKAGAAALALFVFVLSMMGTLAEGKQELPIARLFASFMLYMVGFSYVSTVSLENRYDSTVSTVDNIPVGVAVPASLISNIGLNLATLSETAFGNVNPQERITQRGYLSPLKSLTEFRNLAFKSCPAGEQNSVLSGYKFCPSYRNYVRDCLKVKAMRDAESANIREKDFLTALKFNSKAFATVLIQSSGAIEELSCADAYSKIETMFNSSSFDTMTNVMGERLGVKVGTETTFELTKDILESIGADSSKANNLLKTVMAFKLTEEGEYSYYYKNNASDYAENLSSSITKRNFDWTMQGEMFIQIVNKLLTVFECLLYAITPFIALMVLCGSVGSKSLMLYLQMLAIIQLIPTLLVVSQNIIMDNMKEAVNVISAQYETGSIEWMLAVFDEAQEQIAAGGWVSAVVVPAMAMSLVTGTGMAMMGAFKGAAAQAKDTDATPEITKQGGATESIESLNLGTRDSYGNVMTSNFESKLGDIGRNIANSSSVSNAETRMKQAQNNYNEALENVFTKQDGSTYTSGELISYGNSINSNSGTIENFAKEKAQSYSGYADMSASEQNQLSGLLSGSLGLGLGKLGVGVQSQEHFMEGVSQNVRDAYTELTSGKKGEVLQAQYQEAKQAAMQKNENVQSNNSELDSKSERVSKAHQEVLASTQQYQEARNANDTASFMLSNKGMALAMMAKDEDTMNKANELIGKHRNDADWMRRYTQNLNEADGGVNGTDLGAGEAKLAALMITNNETGNAQDNLKLLSSYDGYKTQNAKDLLNNSEIEKNKVPKKEELPEFKGKDEQKPVEPPKRGSVPTKLDPAKFDGYKSDVQNDFEANKARVQKEAEDFKNSDEMKPYVNKYNELKNKVDFANKDVVPFEHSKEFVDKSLDQLSNFSPEEAFNSVKNIIMQSFEQPAMQDFKEGLTNGYEAAKEIYNTARAAYYDSPIGQAEIKSLDFLEKQFNALEQTLSKGGSEAYQGFSSFLDDVSTELTKMFVEPSQGVYQGTNPQKPDDGGTGSTILSDIASGMAQADYMSNEEFLVEHGAELDDDFSYSSDISRDEEKQAIFDTVKGRGYTDEEATLAANTIDKVREYEDIKSQLELTDEDNPRRESAEKYLELLDQQIQSVNSEFGGGLFTNYSNDDANQPVIGNAAGESSTGAQTQSPEQPLNTQSQVAEPSAEAPEATQPVMAAATTAGNAAGELDAGAQSQAQGNAEAINTQAQVAEPNADAPEAVQPVMAAATTAGNAAGES